MTPLSHEFTTWLADYYLLTSVLLVVAAIALVVLKQPAKRRAVTHSTLVGLLLLAALCAVPGWSLLNLTSTPATISLDQPVVARTDDFDRDVATAFPAQQLNFDPPSQQPAENTSPTVVEPLSDVPPSVSVPAPEVPWSLITIYAWTTGAISAVAWLTVGLWAAYRLRRNSQPAPADFIAMLHDLEQATHDRATELLTSSRISVAVALGIWRPAVLLPAEWLKSQSRDDLRTVLAHEAAHLRNRDLHWLALSRGLNVLLWAQPLFWFVRRRLRLDQEALADAAAAELTSRDRYAEKLVALAHVAAARPTVRLSSAVGLWEGPSQLRRRVALLIDERFTVVRNCSRRWRHGVGLLAVIAATCLSLITLEAQTRTEGESDNAARKNIDNENRPADAAPPANTAVISVDESPPQADAQKQPNDWHRKLDNYKPNSIIGRCVDENDQPLADVDVVLLEANFVDRPPRRIATQRTDANGRYEFKLADEFKRLFPDGKIPAISSFANQRVIAVVARSPGRASTGQMDLPSRIVNRGLALQHEMPPAATLRGRIIGPDGRPVVGATVFGSSPTVPHWDGIHTARTDDDGQYIINDLAPFDVSKFERDEEARRKEAAAARSDTSSMVLFQIRPQLTVEHASFAMKHTGFDNVPGTMNVKLDPAGIIGGRVLDDSGRPLADVTVRARTTLPQNTEWSVGPVHPSYSRSVRTDAQGRFRFSTLPTGTYDIWPEADDWIHPGIGAIKTTTDLPTFLDDFSLSRGGTVKVRLVDADSKPIAIEAGDEAIMSVSPLKPLSARPFIFMRQPIKPQLDGTWEIRALPGEQTFWLHAVNSDGHPKWVGPGGDLLKKNINVPEGETLPIDAQVVTAAEAVPNADFVAFVGQSGPALLARAEAWQKLGDYAKAVADYEQLIKLNPTGATGAVAHNNLAYLLSAAPDESIRNGKRAIELAKKAQELHVRPSADILDTLAAAYAEAGDFDEAIKTQREAIKLAPKRKEFLDFLKLYESGQPRRETRPQRGATTQASAAENSVAAKQNAEKRTADQPQSPNTLMDLLRVRVTDANGDPIEGVTVTPFALRGGDLGSHFGWQSGFEGQIDPQPATTEKLGIATVRYPRHIQSTNLRTSIVSLRFNHPEYVEATQDVPVGNTPNPIQLARGGVIEIAANSKGEAVRADLFGQGAGWGSTWTPLESGAIRSPHLPADTANVRVVWLPKNGPAQFSDVLTVAVTENGTQALNVDLQPGMRLVGTLDESVPRPVKNGRAFAIVDSPGENDWHDWTLINDDGTFEFASLPGGDGAVAQLIAICDGFVSKPPNWNADDEPYAKPQTVELDGDSVNHAMEMIPTASATLKLSEHDGRPIPSARVSFGPNISWTTGNGMFAHPAIRTADLLRDPHSWSKNAAKLMDVYPFQAKSDDHGVAELKNLPPFAPFSVDVRHDQFQLPLTANSRDGRRFAELKLQSGKTSELELVLEPTEAAVAEQEVSDTELAGTVLGADGKPLAGVTVDVWTWYRGNETKTDVRGRFRLKGFEPNEHLEVEFSKAGYEPRLFYDHQAGTSNWTIPMDNRTFLEGTVTDPQGKTVANALIRAERGPFQNPQVVVGEVATETRTDDDGHYRLYLEPATYSIKIRVPDRGVARFDSQSIASGEQKTFDVELKDGITFRAKIVDSETGKPVKDIRLFNWRLKGIEGVSDEDGILEIPELFPGKIELQVRGTEKDAMRSSVAGNYARWWSDAATHPHQRKEAASGERFQRNLDDLEFEIGEQAEPVTIYVEPCVMIIGRVVNPDGKPVAGATATAAQTGTGNSLTGDTRYSYETKSDGTFEMKLPASGPVQYNLIAHDGKYGQWRKWANAVNEAFSTKPGQKIENIELRLTRPATIRGRVLVDGEAAPAGKQVSAADHAKRDNRYYIPTTKTDGEGRFELKFVSPGKQVLQFEWAWLNANVVSSEAYKHLDVEEGATIDDVELRITTQPAAPVPPGVGILRVNEAPPPKPAADPEPKPEKPPEAAPDQSGPVLKGQVFDEYGKPIPDVNVILYGGIATRFRGQQTKTNDNGDYEFKPLETGAMTSTEEGGGEWYTGIEFKHPKFVPADGKSWRDISVPNEKDHEEVLDLKMTRGGKIRATVIDPESKKPVPNLDLRLYNGFIDGKETGDFHVYATTDANGKFTSEPLFPGHYVIDINDNNYQGKYRFPRIGQADVKASETTVLRLTAHELRTLLDPFHITGTAAGDDGKSMVYGGVGVRLLGEDAKLRTRGGGIDGRNVFGLKFGPIKRSEATAEAPYGIGTHDVELVGNNTRFGYTLVKRTPSEPLRITDDPNKPEVENGIRYIRPNQPVEFELVFSKDDVAGK